MRSTASLRTPRHAPLLALPVDPQVLQRLFEAAHAAPSVGLSQPWRLVRITRPELRQRIYTWCRRSGCVLLTRSENAVGSFLRLKVEGVLECGELLVVAVRDGGDTESSAGAHCRRWTWHDGLRHTESMACCARRRAGHGVVSMFDPQALAGSWAFHRT